MRRNPNAQSILASVVVPAYKEVGNVRPLVTRVFAALKASNGRFTPDNTELIFVDDNSRDGTEAEVQKLQEEGYGCRIIVRTTERGLSSAVLRGFQEAQGEIMLCMDADLQHPPENVPDLLAALDQDGIEFVIGTRYGEGVAIDKDWPMHRRVISKTARLMSRPLTPLSDPMTGFFGIRKTAFLRGGDKISSLGFKICLELYVKCGVRRHSEVPFSFGVRLAGESKLTGKVIVEYLKQLWELYQFSAPGALPVAFLLLVVFAFAALFYTYALIRAQ